MKMLEANSERYAAWQQNCLSVREAEGQKVLICKTVQAKPYFRKQLEQTFNKKEKCKADGRIRKCFYCKAFNSKGKAGNSLEFLSSDVLAKAALRHLAPALPMLLHISAASIAS